MGAFADLGSLFLDEDERAKALDLEKLKLEFMQLTLEQLEIVAEYINGRLPTKTHLALLLSEVLGNRHMEQLRLESNIAVVLNEYDSRRIQTIRRDRLGDGAVAWFSCNNGIG